ncbi:MAG: hypothetical protein LC742_08770 [Acidobacteria bacterium]|nr:hypothetical protein [Acidobacteriota bacterium]
MPRAATPQTTKQSSKRTSHQPQSTAGQITSRQVWQQLSATQQQLLQRTLVNVCRHLVSKTASNAGSEEVHNDDQS